MSTSNIPIKDSVDELILCLYCLKEKNHSKRFPSNHALKWHLTNQHRGEIAR